MGLIATSSDTNPVTLDDAKTHLRIVNDIDDGAASSDDAALQVYLDAAWNYIETETRQQFVTCSYQLFLDGFPHHHRHRGYNTDPYSFGDFADEHYTGNYRHRHSIQIPRPPLQSVSSIQYLDINGNLQTLDPSLYIVDTATQPGRVVLQPGQSFPETNHAANCVTISFTAGYGDADTVPTILKQCILILTGSWFENREDSITLRINSIPLGVKSIIDQQQFMECVA